MSTQLKERPFRMYDWEVRAVLEGRKTMARRVVKPQPDKSLHEVWKRFPNQDGCPYGVPGDRLWVRETWCCVHGIPASDQPHADDFVRYRADAGDGERAIDKIRCWKPSIHMPRCYSRITLEITGVRVERVQDISEVDAVAEGIHRVGAWLFSVYGGRTPVVTTDPTWSFHTLWDSINAKRGYGWDANPFVWAIEFRRIA